MDISIEWVKQTEWNRKVAFLPDFPYPIVLVLHGMLFGEEEICQPWKWFSVRRCYPLPPCLAKPMAGSENRHGATPIGEVGNASMKTYLRMKKKKTPWEALFPSPLWGVGRMPLGPIAVWLLGSCWQGLSWYRGQPHGRDHVAWASTRSAQVATAATWLRSVQPGPHHAAAAIMARLAINFICLAAFSQPCWE